MKRLEVPATRSELSKMLKQMSFNEIEDRLWQLYGIIGTIADTHTAETEVEETTSTVGAEREKITDTAKAGREKINVTASLPKDIGDISIMRIEELYEALDQSTHADPTPGYDTSVYYVYAINDTAGIDDSLLSDPDNLKAVGTKWYKSLTRPTKSNTHWIVGNHTLFGGPLNNVYYYGFGMFNFYWCCPDGRNDYSRSSNYWGSYVSGFTYVAVVRKRPRQSYR